MNDPVRPHRWQSTRAHRPWDSQSKNTGVGCHFLLQGLFPTQGLNSDVRHCRQTLPSEPQGSPIHKLENNYLWWRHRSTVACRRVRDTDSSSHGRQCAGESPFGEGHHCPYHSLASAQTTGMEHNTTHQQKVRFKIY